MRPIAAIKARIWIAQGNLSEAADWARDRGVSATDDASYLREFDHLTLVRLLLAQHRADPDTGAADRALGLLDRLLEAAETAGRAGSLLEIRMLQASPTTRRDIGRRPGDAWPEPWTEAPEPEGYVRLFLDEGAPMVSLLRDAVQPGVGRRPPARLLSLDALVEQSSRPTPARAAVAPSAESLSERELQVLRLLDSELTGPEIARELFVSHNTLRTHTKHIFTKLDVTSRRAAVLRARERGLL